MRMLATKWIQSVQYGGVDNQYHSLVFGGNEELPISSFNYIPYFDSTVRVFLVLSKGNTTYHTPIVRRASGRRSNRRITWGWTQMIDVSRLYCNLAKPGDTGWFIGPEYSSERIRLRRYIRPCLPVPLCHIIQDYLFPPPCMFSNFK